MAQVEYFTETVQALLAHRQVKMARLVFFDFVDAPTYLWMGSGKLLTGGHMWTGAGKLLSLSEQEQSLKGEAPSLTITLSGVDADIVSKSVNSVDLVRDREVKIYDQYFAVTSGWAPLDGPTLVASAIMKNIGFKRQGPTNRSISVACEGPFYRRGIHKYSFYTDRDQQRRFPGDRGLEFIPTLVDKTTRWPFTG